MPRRTGRKGVKLRGRGWPAFVTPAVLLVVLSACGAGTSRQDAVLDVAQQYRPLLIGLDHHLP